MLHQDVDLGSDLSLLRSPPKKTLYFFRIENLDVGISVSDIMDFIHEEVFLTSHAFICDTTATILVDTKEAANNLHDFLEDSSHIIVSSRGR